MYTIMLPRLEAQAQLSAMQVAMASNERMMDERPHAQFMADLERQARGETHLKRARSEGDLSKLGIRVRTEEGEKEAGT